MSDFVSEFWNLYVIVIVLVSVVGCWVFLLLQSKAKFTPGVPTGHVWDETLEEYNNPMPKWWSWMYVLTVIFSLVYLALYPGLGNFKGMLGWTSAGQHTAEVAKMDAAVKPLYDKYKAMDLQAVAADKQAMEMGKRLYLTYCMQCHGADARGAKGFPNLADADGLTPLMRAADRGDVERVKALLAAKADAGAKDRLGRTARDWAESRDDDLGRAVAAVLPASGG